MSDKFPAFPENGPHMNGSRSHGSDNGYARVMLGEPEEKEMSLHDVIEILLKGKWILMAAFVLTVLATAAYTFSQDPVYEATSVVHVSNEGNSPQLDELIGNNTVEAARSIATEIEIIRSLSSASRVAEAILNPNADTSSYAWTVDHDRLTVLASGTQDSVSMEVLAHRLRGMVQVRPVSAEVDLIQIIARSTVPEEAQLVANLYAQTYRDFNLSASRERMTASREFLDEISSTFSTQLEQAEEELTQFLNEESIVEPDAEARQTLEQISELQQQQSQTQLQLGVAQAEIRRLENELERITPGLAAKISSSDNLVIDQLKQQIANLQFEEQQIFASHPERRSLPRTGRLADLEQELNELTQQLNELVERLVGPVVSNRVQAMESRSTAGSGASSAEGLLQTVEKLRGLMMDKDIQISGLNARLTIINEQLEQHQSRLAQIPAQSVILQRLQRSQRAQEQLYLSLLDELQQARIAEQSELGSIKIVDEAGVSTTPVSPRVPQNLMFGAVFGLLLGIGLAFVRNAFDDKIRRPDDLKQFDLDVLAVIPRLESTIEKNFGADQTVSIEGYDFSTSLVGLLLPMSRAAQAYRALRVSIQFTHHRADLKTIVCTSPEPGDGKSLTALNLAVMMAKSGNETLYIDADLHRPRSHQLISIDREPGLTDELLAESRSNLAHYQVGIEHLTVLPAGRKVPNPAEVLGSKRMKEFLADLKEKFDVIVLDTPPLLAVIDAVILASMSDATVLVCAANKTHSQAAGLAIEKLKHVNAPVAGIVLNRFDAVQAFGAQRYGARYGFGDYGYGERDETEGRKFFGRRRRAALRSFTFFSSLLFAAVLCLQLLAAAFVLTPAAAAQTMGDLTESRSSNAAYFRFTEPGDVTMNVSVWGGVVHPGLYEVPEGTRVNTIITLAGGLPLGVIDNSGGRIRRTLQLRLLRPAGASHAVVFEHTMQNSIIVSEDNPELQHDDVLVVELEEHQVNSFTWRDGLSIVTAVAALVLAAERVLTAVQ